MNGDTEGEAMERRIRIMLDRIGIPVSLRGYGYLFTAIETVCGSSCREMIKLVECLYLAVAKKHGTSVSCVERSMRSAIKSAWEEYPERFEMYLYVKRKPTTGEFIMKMAHRAQYSI